ncbi:MAG: hypothetical protein WC476_03475 [Phycisphaerae bacterium]|jgi:hypothetical protein
MSEKEEKKKSLEQKVIEDLQLTGFASEMHSIKAFISKDWSVSGSPSYFDLDENKTREFDLIAHHTIYEDEPESKKRIAQTFFQIVGEVKKTKNPWVVFKENQKNIWKAQEGWNGLVFCDGVLPGAKTLTPAMMTTGLGSRMNWYAYGIHEAFKNPDQPSKWYSALAKLCKAGEDKLKANSNKQDNPYLFFVKPVLILDGILMAASISETGDIEVEKVDGATIDFDFSSKAYTRGNYKIDIVCLGKLDIYLDFCEKRNAQLYQALKKDASC